MTDPVFCYHCRRYHPAREMTRVQAKGVTRWRCLKSLVSSRNTQQERDAFGRETSASNKAGPQRPLPHCVRELFACAPQGLGGSA